MSVNQTCHCWRCWFQQNFSVILLSILLIMSVFATLTLMHEESIADKYVIGLEGWDAGLLTALGVALKPDGSKQNHEAIPAQQENPPNVG